MPFFTSLCIFHETVRIVGVVVDFFVTGSFNHSESTVTAAVLFACLLCFRLAFIFIRGAPNEEVTKHLGL